MVSCYRLTSGSHASVVELLPTLSYLPSPSLRVQLHSIPVLDMPLPSVLLAVSSVQLL